LHPDTASEYAYQLHYVAGAKQYNTLLVDVGDKVEVELADRGDPIQPFPRGTMVHGILRDIAKPEAPQQPENASAEEQSRAMAEWKRNWIYLVEELARGRDGERLVEWDGTGQLVAFSEEPPTGEWRHASNAVDFRGPVTKCQHVLIDFGTNVGVRAVDDYTLVVTLTHPTPFFSELLTFYPLYAVNRSCIERYGSPGWTKPENIVTNGPFLLHFRRIRDRIRLVKNPNYWNAGNVHLQVVDALPVKSRITAMNMFLNGELDWNHAPPGNMIPLLKDRPEYRSGPALVVYFYRLNTGRPGLNDRRVRQALNLALDKSQICTYVTQAGEQPARSLVPPGMSGYEPASCGTYNPDRGKQLLAEAGFPDGRGFPRIEILFNSDEMHKSIAEVIQQQWKRTLGIDVDLRGIAWPAYLDAMHKSDFDICRAGWVPDYTDPNTFLDMFVTGGTHNNTNWGNPRYDELITAAGREPDTTKRLQMFREAETILMDELPIIPIYYYVTKNLVKSRVQNFYPNLHDSNPISALRVNDLSVRRE
jgi:oligopeptide transport system substrate-binding protein